MRFFVLNGLVKRLNFLHIENKAASAVRPNDQIALPRVNGQIIDGGCGQMAAEGVPYLASIDRDIHAQVRADIEDISIPRVLLDDVDRLGRKVGNLMVR